MRPTPRRLWRLRLGIRAVLRRGTATGEDLQRIVGHAVFVGLCKRESLSIFASCYRFAKRFEKCPPAPLWCSVRKELDLWERVSPLLWTDLASQWSSGVVTVDASPWGLGAVRAEADPARVRECGRESERWRFRLPTPAPSARRRALGALVDSLEEGSFEAAAQASGAGIEAEEDLPDAWLPGEKKPACVGASVSAVSREGEGRRAEKLPQLRRSARLQEVPRER